jgi:predicted permease
MHTQIIIQQILFLGIIIFLGMVATWLKVINETVNSSIASIAFNLASPALIFTTFSEIQLTREVVVNGTWIVFFTFLAALLFYVFGWSGSRLFGLRDNQARVHVVHTMFGNTVFLGFPLVSSLFPERVEAVPFAALYFFVSSSVLWTFGIMLISNKSGNFLKSTRNLINPNSMAFLAGLALAGSGLELPQVVNGALTSLGKATSPISMLFIGGTLAMSPPKGILNRKDLFALVMNKLLLVPFLLLVIISEGTRVFGWQISEMTRAILILQTGTPCMTTVVILARNYGKDDGGAAENFIVTTVLSLFTLPLLYILIQSY